MLSELPQIIELIRLRVINSNQLSLGYDNFFEKLVIFSSFTLWHKIRAQKISDNPLLWDAHTTLST